MLTFSNPLMDALLVIAVAMMGMPFVIKKERTQELTSDVFGVVIGVMLALYTRYEAVIIAGVVLAAWAAATLVSHILNRPTPVEVIVRAFKRRRA
jgi:hypothetical protein